MKKLKLFGLAVIFSFTTQLWAQEKATPEKDYAVFDLGKLLVIEEKSMISQVGIINVVTAEEIQAHNAHTVAQALSYVPGLIVATGNKNDPIISIHGLGTEKMIIMLDGVPIYETFYRQRVRPPFRWEAGLVRHLTRLPPQFFFLSELRVIVNGQLSIVNGQLLTVNC